MRGVLAARSHGAKALSAFLLGIALLVAASCASGPDAGAPRAGTSSAAVLPHSGPAVELRVSEDALANKPKPWVLDSPEAAVRSYLAWTAYANRIARSDVATPTMTPFELVVVDSYIQFNLEKRRLLDETLQRVTFGKPASGATSTLVPVREEWSYRYLATDVPGKVLGGPYKASYDATYTVVRSEAGEWRVDRSQTRPLGEVK